MEVARLRGPPVWLALQLFACLLSPVLGFELQQFELDEQGFETYVEGQFGAYSRQSGEIWVLGGYNKLNFGVYKKSVYSCRPPQDLAASSHQWVRHADITTDDDNGIWNSAQNSVILSNGMMYMTGGNYAGMIHSYNISDHTWQQNSSLSYPNLPRRLQVSSLCKSGDDRWLFVTGGNTGIKDFYAFDLSGEFGNGSWLRGPDMNRRRATHGCAVAGQYLYVFGGNTTTIERFKFTDYLEQNNTELKWELIQTAQLVWADYGTRAVTAQRPGSGVEFNDELIYLYGGSGLEGMVATDLIQVFDTNTLTIYNSTVHLSQRITFGNGLAMTDQDTGEVQRLYHIAGANYEGYVSNFLQYSNTDVITPAPTAQGSGDGDDNGGGGNGDGDGDSGGGNGGDDSDGAGDGSGDSDGESDGDGGKNGTSSEDDSRKGGSSGSDDGDSDWWIWLLISLAAVSCLCCCGACVWYGNSQRERKKADPDYRLFD